MGLRFSTKVFSRLMVSVYVGILLGMDFIWSKKMNLQSTYVYEQILDRQTNGTNKRKVRTKYFEIGFRG